jgi:hypothetical protein
MKLFDPELVCLIPRDTFETAFTTRPNSSLGIQQAILGIDDFGSACATGTNDTEWMIFERGQTLDFAINKMDINTASGIADAADS